MKNDKIIIMKTLITATFAALMFFAFEMTVPKSSEAGVTCRYDVFGNYVCKETGIYNSLGGNSSSTRRNALGQDVTTFKNQYGQTTGSMSCKTDVFGNYVCN